MITAYECDAEVSTVAAEDRIHGSSRMPEYDPVAVRTAHRISAFYAVDAPESLVRAISADVGVPIARMLNLDRLTSAYEASWQQFPVVLSKTQLEQVEFGHVDCVEDAARGWLMALPNDVLVAAVSVDVTCDMRELVLVLEDLHHRRVSFAGCDLWNQLKASCSTVMRPLLDQSRLSLETYNLLHVSDENRDALRNSAGDPDVQKVSSLVYRFEDSYTRWSQRIKVPGESNRGSAFAVTGPYVGVTCRNQGYVENSLFVSAAVFVGALATLRRTRHGAFLELRRARSHLADGQSGIHNSRDLRVILTQTSRRLAQLQLNLSAGVEANMRFASTVPSLRVSDFHEALFDSAGIAGEVATIGTILDRITSALAAESDRRSADERQADERRATIRSAAFGFVTVVALPLGIVFGYFGVGTRDVRPSSSLFDIRAYWGFYMSLAALLVVAGLIAGALAIKFSLEARRQRDLAGEVS